MISKAAIFLAIGSLVHANLIPPNGGGVAGGWPRFSIPWGPPAAPTGAPTTVTLPATTVTLPASTVTLTITVGAGGTSTTSPSQSSTSSVTSITTSSSTSSLSPSSTASVVDVAAATKSVPILDGFVSFSIEFAFFPDFAGSYQLLQEVVRSFSDGIRKREQPQCILR